ncbi:MAG: stringent starvation protein B [Parvularculaceae bacterium]|nr:stringent starvation protein B [Parvularculaceae bacterium]
MAEEVELDYEYLTQRALRRVVFDALTVTADIGKAPGAHHFYIEFQTGHAGVDMPPELRAAYPERMTIVLQHQFENLVVDDEGFAVTLKFKGRPARLVVPFEAVTAFSDPGASFGLRFDAVLAGQAPAPRPVEPKARQPHPPKPKPLSEGGAEVVSLDKFRKK